MQRVKTEKNLRALSGPAAAEAAQEQQRAANRAVKASALPPGFALDERWRSTLSPTTSEPGFSQPSQASMPRTCKLFALSWGERGSKLNRQHTTIGQRRSGTRRWRECLEWSYDQGTTQDMASKTLAAVRRALPNLPRPMSRSFLSAIACLQGWKRLDPGASRQPAPRVLVLGGALACRAATQNPGSPLLPALRDVQSTVGRIGAARLQALSADQSIRGKSTWVTTVVMMPLDCRLREDPWWHDSHPTMRQELKSRLYGVA